MRMMQETGQMRMMQVRTMQRSSSPDYDENLSDNSGCCDMMGRFDDDLADAVDRNVIFEDFDCTLPQMESAGAEEPTSLV